MKKKSSAESFAQRAGGGCEPVETLREWTSELPPSTRQGEGEAGRPSSGRYF